MDQQQNNNNDNYPNDKLDVHKEKLDALTNNFFQQIGQQQSDFSSGRAEAAAAARVYRTKKEQLNKQKQTKINKEKKQKQKQNNKKRKNELSQQNNELEEINKQMTLGEYATDSNEKTIKKIIKQQNSNDNSDANENKVKKQDDDFEYESNQADNICNPAEKAQKSINSTSFKIRKNSQNKKWDEKETEAFYKYLQLFGTDFTTIQSFLKTKTVTQIKNKYNREERENPDKILFYLSQKSLHLSNDFNNKLSENIQQLQKHYDHNYKTKPQTLPENNLILSKEKSEELQSIPMIILEKKTTVQSQQEDDIAKEVERNIVERFNKEAEFHNKKKKEMKKKNQESNNLLEILC